MKRLISILIILVVGFAGVATSQDYTYTLKKTMSANAGNTDYSFYKFPVGSFSGQRYIKGDTVDLNIAVDLAKDNPAIPSLELKFGNVSGSTDSLYISGTVKGSQFHLMTTEPTTGLTLKTINSTKISLGSTDPYYYVIADSVNSGGFVIAKTGVSHLRSVLYSLRLIPRGTSDTVRITGITFKTWVNPKY
jgi:hypothetical protein